MAKKRSRDEEDEEEETEEDDSRTDTGFVRVQRVGLIKKSKLPATSFMGGRNPEYMKLVDDLIKLCKRDPDRAITIKVKDKLTKQRIREGVRPALRRRGYDLTAVSDRDEELGMLLHLFATRKINKKEEEEEDDE